MSKYRDLGASHELAVLYLQFDSFHYLLLNKPISMSLRSHVLYLTMAEAILSYHGFIFYDSVFVLVCVFPLVLTCFES